MTTRRRELDLTLGDVASALGVSPMDVSGWALGEAVPDNERLVALAEVFQTPADELAEMAGVSLDGPPEPAVNLMPAAEPEPEAAEPAEAMAADAIAAPPEVGLPDDFLEEEEEEEEEEEVASDQPQAASEPEVQREPERPADIEPIETAPEEASDTAIATLEETPAAPPIESVPPADEPELAAEPAPLAPPLAAATPARADDPPPFVTPEGRAEQSVATAPVGYVQDSRMMLRYRIRWAITTVVLVIMLFIGLWASRELIDALSLVFESVTP